MPDKQYLTPEQKLDFLYNYFKQQQKYNRIKYFFKFLYRFIIIFYIFYLYFYIWPDFKNSFLKPILGNIGIKNFSFSEIKNFLNNKNSVLNAVNNGQKSTSSLNFQGNGLNLTKEKIDKIQEIINGK